MSTLIFIPHINPEEFHKRFPRTYATLTTNGVQAKCEECGQKLHILMHQCVSGKFRYPDQVCCLDDFLCPLHQIPFDLPVWISERQDRWYTGSCTMKIEVCKEKIAMMQRQETRCWI